jgi:hypothetical protein
MLEVTFSLGSCAIVERCRHEFKKNFLPWESSQIGHACADILEMIGCCLHLLENSLYAQQASD